MKDAGDRLRELRLKKGFSTASDASRAFGWNENTYKSHEGGIRGIRIDAARKYASAFNSTAAYILTGSDGVNHQSVQSVVNVPVIARVSAGAFRYDEGVEEGALEVPAVPRRDVPAALQYSVIVDGPSVNKRIPDGAYAICAPYDSFPGGAQHGQLVHVVRERAGLHEHTIKELRFTATGMVLMPVSDDPRYQEQVTLSAGEDGETVRIQGIVIGAYVPL
jgi:SOS-response transcriptional repressor LexA